MYATLHLFYANYATNGLNIDFFASCHAIIFFFFQAHASVVNSYWRKLCTDMKLRLSFLTPI